MSGFFSSKFKKSRKSSRHGWEDKAETDAKPDGLAFGQSRGVLPRDAETLAFSFLSFEDLANVYILTRAMAARVAYALKVLPVVRASSHSTLQRRALFMVAKHCRKLKSIEVACSTNPDKFDLIVNWFLHILAQNKNTLERARLFWLGDTKIILRDRILRSLRECNELQSLELCREGISKISLNLITPAHFPALRSLTLEQDNVDVAPGGGLAVNEDLERVLWPGDARTVRLRCLIHVLLSF